MRKLLVLLCLVFSACTNIPAQSADVPTNTFLNDLATAQKDFQNAAARQPAGSALAVRFTADAQCIGDWLATLQGATIASCDVQGLASGGACAVIAAAELRERLTQTDASSANCDQVIGGIFRRINRDVLRTLPMILLKGAP